LKLVGAFEDAVACGIFNLRRIRIYKYRPSHYESHERQLFAGTFDEGTSRKPPRDYVMGRTVE
jgi:hypothetical protein